MTTTIDDEKVHQGALSPELRQLMVEQGGKEILVWLFGTQQRSQDAPSVQSPNGSPAQPSETPPVQTADAPHVQPSDTPPVEPSSEKDDDKKETIDATQRQREQTLRDAAEGWARYYAKAPDEPDAREVVALVAKAIKSLPIRRAVRVTVAHPQYVFIGEKVAGLGGVRGMVVRRLIGPADDIADA
jgi:hypothetical protein